MSILSPSDEVTSINSGQYRNWLMGPDLPVDLQLRIEAKNIALGDSTASNAQNLQDSWPVCRVRFQFWTLHHLLNDQCHPSLFVRLLSMKYCSWYWLVMTDRTCRKQIRYFVLLGHVIKNILWEESSVSLFLSLSVCFPHLSHSLSISQFLTMQRTSFPARRVGYGTGVRGTCRPTWCTTAAGDRGNRRHWLRRMSPTLTRRPTSAPSHSATKALQGHGHWKCT